MEQWSFDVRALTVADDIAGFRSGVHALDDYLQRHARNNDVAGIARTYVAVRADEGATPRLLGFYTLSMANSDATEIATVHAARLPRYPMPATLIGRLAVDERARGHRVGSRLLRDALSRALDASLVVGCLGVIVDAKDEHAASFYAKHAFEALRSSGPWPRRMYLPMATIRATLGG